MKRMLLCVLVGGLVSQAFGNLLISEYIEGGSYNKAVEIYNAGDTAVDFSQYEVRLHSSGQVNANGTFEGIGMIEPGDVFVVCHASAAAEILAVRDATASAINWNGDDACVLVQTFGDEDESNDVIVDIVGTIVGVDPGSCWPVADQSCGTKDHTLVRKMEVTEGTADWALSAGTDEDDSQWIVYPKDDMTHIGFHGTPPANTPPVIGELVHTPEIVTSADAVSISAEITDDSAVQSVVLTWSLNGFEQATIPMTDPDEDDVYTLATPIGALVGGSDVSYEVVATDDDGETTTVYGGYGVVYQLSIYDVQYTDNPSGQSDYYEMDVQVEGYVTYAPSDYRMYIQLGDGAWNGILVYGSNGGVEVGDYVRVSAEVDEYWEYTELVSPTVELIESGGRTQPQPVLVSTADLTGEAYEGVLVRVEYTYCVDAYNFYVSDASGTAIRIYEPSYSPVANACYNAVGVIGDYHGEHQIYLLDGENSLESCDVADAVETPASFQLLGSYPNPFNPSTVIRFELDQTSAASLNVYDITGRKVASLLQGTLEAGEHQITFDASGMTSGVYFYTLQSEGRSLTGKMLLAR